MPNYLAYGHRINIDLALNLPQQNSQNSDFNIKSKNSCLPGNEIEWIHEYEASGGVTWIRLGRAMGSYVLRFDGNIDFVVDKTIDTINYYSNPKLQSSTFEHLLLDQLIPRLLSRKNLLVLHAGAVANEHGAIGFIGKTGMGKSTLSTFLGQNGYSVVSDDCLVLRQEEKNFTAYPSYRAVRLNPDMARALVGDLEHLPYVAGFRRKIRLDSETGKYVNQDKPGYLHALFILDSSKRNKDTANVSIQKLSQRDAFSHLIKNTFRLDPTDKQSNVYEFKNIGSLVAAVPIYSLSFKRQQRQLKYVLNALNEFFTDSS